MFTSNRCKDKACFVSYVERNENSEDTVENLFSDDEELNEEDRELDSCIRGLAMLGTKKSCAFKVRNLDNKYRGKGKKNIVDGGIYNLGI